MKFGVYVPNVYEYGDPTLLLSLAILAEESGWDGFFLWDDFGTDEPHPVIDPWPVLGAIAANTSRILLGPMVVPLARRRPWKVAREAVTVDHLSNGRFILGVGLGGLPDTDFAPYGEATDARTRAQMLDESLDIITQLWTGEADHFEGKHYTVDMQRPFLPRPLQKPRIPIWVAGGWPNKRPFRRAAQWDGVFPLGRDLPDFHQMSPSAMAAMRAYTLEQRTNDDAFDVVQMGITTGTDRVADKALVDQYATAGVTWWLEHFHPGRADIDTVRAHIKQGPPR